MTKRQTKKEQRTQEELAAIELVEFDTIIGGAKFLHAAGVRE